MACRAAHSPLVSATMEPLVDIVIEDDRWEAFGLEPLADRAIRAAMAELDLAPEGFTLRRTSPGRLDIPAKVNGTAQFTQDVKLDGMLVAVMAPGLTMAFISAPLYCSTATIELKAWPVASTPMLFAIASGPCSASWRTSSGRAARWPAAKVSS